MCEATPAEAWPGAAALRLRRLSGALWLRAQAVIAVAGAVVALAPLVFRRAPAPGRARRGARVLPLAPRRATAPS